MKDFKVKICSECGDTWILPYMCDLCHSESTNNSIFCEKCHKYYEHFTYNDCLEKGKHQFGNPNYVHDETEGYWSNGIKFIEDGRN